MNISSLLSGGMKTLDFSAELLINITDSRITPITQSCSFKNEGRNLKDPVDVFINPSQTLQTVNSDELPPAKRHYTTEHVSTNSEKSPMISISKVYKFVSRSNLSFFCRDDGDVNLNSFFCPM